MSMNMSRIWIRIGAGFLIAVGAMLALAAYLANTDLAALLINSVQWPVAGLAPLASAEIIRINGTTGGMLIGWGLMIWLVAGRLYAKEPRLVGFVILASMGTWCVIDSIASLFAGAPLNVVANIVFLLIFAVPLSLAARSR